MKLLRIEQGPAEANGLVRTQGTRVLAEGDVEIEGITRIELIAEIDDVWRARLDCMVRPPATLAADALISYPKRRLTIKERLLGWISAQ